MYYFCVVIKRRNDYFGMKINNDKYYTPIDIADYCYEKVKEVIGEENITDIIEPSCGDGSFLHHPMLMGKSVLGIDIELEVRNNEVNAVLLTCDFLEYEIPYKVGRLVIGNPPYGQRMNLAQKFFKKSVGICDYIAFILPISQLNNTQSLFEFDLVYSEDLGICKYSDRDLHCCFNIYKRPANGLLNKKIKNKLSYISICRNDSKKYEVFPFDVRMCAWGDGSAGKILEDGERYSAEYKIKVDENHPLYFEIVEYIRNYDWRKYVECIAMKKIQQFHIIDVLRMKFGL